MSVPQQNKQNIVRQSIEEDTEKLCPQASLMGEPMDGQGSPKLRQHGLSQRERAKNLRCDPAN